MQPNLKIPEACANVLLPPSRLKILYGGRGGAKSESVARYLLAVGMNDPMTILCAREFQSSIKDSVHQLLSNIIEQNNLNSFYTVYKTEIHGENGTKIVFAGLRTNIASIKSMHDIKKCWVEEAETVSDRSWDVLIPTIRAKDSEIIVTFNPDIEDSPTYQRMVIEPPDYSLVAKISYKDNPYFPDVLEIERVEMEKKNPAKYDNIWLGNCKAAIEGAVYQNELRQAEEDGRIGVVPYDPSKPVNTYWDIGEADCMSIWYEQRVGVNRYLIDFTQDNLQKVPYYIDILKEKGYNYAHHVLPHDGDHDRANAEFTTKQMVQRAFPNAIVTCNENFAGAVKMGIEAVRNIFPFLYIDRERCRQGLYSLKMYHYKTDPETGRSYGEKPHHDYSDAPDALRTLAMAGRRTDKRQEKTPKPRVSIIRKSGVR